MLALFWLTLLNCEYISLIQFLFLTSDTDNKLNTFPPNMKHDRWIGFTTKFQIKSNQSEVGTSSYPVFFSFYYYNTEWTIIFEKEIVTFPGPCWNIGVTLMNTL